MEKKSLKTMRALLSTTVVQKNANCIKKTKHKINWENIFAIDNKFWFHKLNRIKLQIK